MPYLNWSEEALELAVHPHADFKTQLSLGLTTEQIHRLHQELKEVFQDPAAFVPELRHALPQGWTIFWKKRAGETRLLLAHPEKDEWVATAAVQENEVETFLDRLLALSGDGDGPAELRMSQVGKTGSVSNIDFLITKVL